MLASPVAILAHGVAKVAQPIAIIAQPIAKVAQPIAIVAQPIAKLRKPRAKSAFPWLDLPGCRDLLGLRQRPHPDPRGC